MTERAEHIELTVDEQLSELRSQIDLVDQEMVALLARRLGLVGMIGDIKRRAGLPVIAINRDHEVRDTFAARCEMAGMPRAFGNEVIGLVMGLGYKVQGRPVVEAPAL